MFFLGTNYHAGIMALIFFDVRVFIINNMNKVIRNHNDFMIFFENNKI